VPREAAAEAEAEVEGGMGVGAEALEEVGGAGMPSEPKRDSRAQTRHVEPEGRLMLTVDPAGVRVEDPAKPAEWGEGEGAERVEEEEAEERVDEEEAAQRAERWDEEKGAEGAERVVEEEAVERVVEEGADGLSWMSPSK
jgi:hypothetical protein